MPAGAPFGNTNARGKILTDALRRALAREGNGDIAEGANKIVEQFLKSAKSGEQWAIREMWDRLEGKAAQPIVGSDEHPPVFVGIAGSDAKL